MTSRKIWDTLLVPIMFLVLSTFSVVQIVNLRQVQEAQRSLDLIKECTTPGTRCYQFSQEAAQKRTAELRLALETAVACALEAPSDVPNAERRAFLHTCIQPATTN